jgi:hypothetical protein
MFYAAIEYHDAFCMRYFAAGKDGQCLLYFSRKAGLV